MKRLPVWLLFLCLLAACRGEAPDGAASGGTGQAPADPAAEPVEPVVLEDVVESDRRYIIGISWPEGIDRYPALAAQLKAYADDARADVLQAVAALGPDTTELYDLALEFKILVDTPELFAVAADGSSYTGGAHGTPLIARFVWLPRQDRMLTAQELIPGAGAWQQISSYVREQLHGALSLRVDADDLPPEERERVAKLAISVLSTLRGSICLYQGEELGLTEAELAFEDLRDPYGIRFWPAFKGRDGCRTPMPWEVQKPHAGFTEAGRSWLPLPPEHVSAAVDVQELDQESVLHHYRQTLAFRKAHPPLFDGEMTFVDTHNLDLLAFIREKDGERLLFVFNLTREAQDFPLSPAMRNCLPIALPGFAPEVEAGVVKLAALDAFCGRI